MGALNDHEYRYSILGLAQVNSKIENNIIFRNLESCILDKKFDLQKFETILRENLSLVNKKNAH